VHFRSWASQQAGEGKSAMGRHCGFMSDEGICSFRWRLGDSVVASLKHGFNRLFFVLTIGWTIYCAVVYPLWFLLKHREAAGKEHNKDYKNCVQLFMVERPDATGRTLQDCFDQADSDYKNASEHFSLRNFYKWDLAFWKLLLPVIIVPPVVLYALVAMSMWVRRGFLKQSHAHGQSVN